MSDKSVEKQFYRVLWKGRDNINSPSWNSVVPTWSRPNINGEQSNPNNYQSAFGTPRPSKTWRKQLAPTPFSGKGKATLDLVNAPGGTTFINDVSNCVSCIPDASLNPLSIKSTIDGNFSFLTIQTPNYLYENAEEYNVPSQNIYDKCISCDPVSNIIRPATTVLSKSYYSDTKGYLQSRNMRFIQKYTPEQIPNFIYNYDTSGININSITFPIPNSTIISFTIPSSLSWIPGQTVYIAAIFDPITYYFTGVVNSYVGTTLTISTTSSSSSVGGPFSNLQWNIFITSGGIPSSILDKNEYFTPNCPQNCSNRTITIYKPNNKKFGVQGAVDSSTRLQKLKLDTVNKNANSFKESFGMQGVAAGSYKATADAPFFVKSNLNHCYKQYYHRNGNPTMCFKTPVADMYHQSLKTRQIYTRPSTKFPDSTYPSK